MDVRELLANTDNRAVICINRQASLRDAARRLRQHNIGSLLVTDNAGYAVGIITERDMVEALAQSAAGPTNPMVAQIMSDNLVTCSLDDDVVDVLGEMNDHHIRHMLVVDEQQPVSMLSIRDFEYACKVLQEKARTDDLTGLHNRRFFLELLDKEFSRSRRFGTPLSVAMIDVDRFKEINDTFGHMAGDDVLATLARLLLAELRAYDIVGRLGGEEFAVAFPNTSIQDARLACHRLMSAIRSQKVEAEGGTIIFTASFGLVEIEETSKDSASLLHQADRLLYKAKNMGRNRLIVGSREKLGINEKNDERTG